MKRDWWTGIGLVLLGVGAATSALLGPLALGVIRFRVSAGAENQLIGGEIVSLGAVAPVAIVAGVLWLRGHRLAPVLALGPAGYAVYTYVQFIIGPEYARYDGNNERFFPLFLALVLLGGAVAVRAWTALSGVTLPAPPDGLRRVLAALLIGLSTLLALAWTGSIASVLSGADVPEYRDDRTLFWLVRLMDLGFVIPAGLVTGVGLLRRAAWATRLSYAVTAFMALEVGAVAAMGVNMALHNDPATDWVLNGATLLGTAGLAWALARLLLALRPKSTTPPTARPTPRAPGGHSAAWR